MNWDPWTGCYSASEGCDNCFYYGPNSKRFGQNTITQTKDFDKPIAANTKGVLRIPSGKIVITSFSSDFFLAEADKWRTEAWAMIKERSDLDFLILTKRIDRFEVSLPDDWGEGYDNVNIGCTVENQELADYRLPLFLSYPIKRRYIACSPLLENIDLSPYLAGIDHVTVAGEAGRDARVCDHEWVLSIREQCKQSGKTFWFKSTGARYRIEGEVKKVNPYKQVSYAKEFDLTFLDGKRFF